MPKKYYTIKRTPVVLHPFFFALYAILEVYVSNRGSIAIDQIALSVLVLFFSTIILYLFFRYKAGNNQRAGFLTTLFLAWLFFGHIYRLIVGTLELSNSPVIDLGLLATWSVVILILGSRKFWDKFKNPNVLTQFLNATSWIVLVLPLYLTIFSYMQYFHQNAIVKSQQSQGEIHPVPDTSEHPDIYVIILDAYGRADYLEKAFLFDNSDFLGFLEQKGFYIAWQSKPNYPQTLLSLASLLNMNYLDEWTKEMGGSNNRAPLAAMIDESNVQLALEEIGYTFVTISNLTQYCDLSNETIQKPIAKTPFNSFEEVILSTTVFDIFARAFQLNIPSYNYETHRYQITKSLKFLNCIPFAPGPKFVYVHILAPHPPFVFDEFGNPVQPNYPYTMADGEAFPGTTSDYATGYTKEIAYLNQEMKSTIATILKNSQEPPIIILQGDHGPGNYFTILGVETEPCLLERFSILNAYYFPDKDYHLLYSTITPVNSFRVVFDNYFGENLPLLEDRNYYAPFAYPYQFTDVTNQVSNCSIDFSH